MSENKRVLHDDADELQVLLQKTFTSSFRSGYVRVEGCTLPEYFMEFAGRLREMAVREGDVFVCSFPKCGTTWVQEMVWCIANDVNLEKAKDTPLQDRFPFLEHSSLFDYRELLKSRPDVKFPQCVLDSVEYVENLRGPRFIKTHLPLQLLPQELRDGTQRAKMIYVSRDPRDCCISYFHHSRLMEGYTGDFQTFLKLFLNGRVSFGPFWDHVLGFWKIRDQPNVLFITYEDMKKDLSSVIQKVAKLLDKTLTEEQTECLKDHLSFESMRNNKAVNYETVTEINRKYGLIQEDGVFMRSGKCGEFLKAMTQNEIDIFNEWCQNNLEGTDYKLSTF